jgi:hypothetical protein
MTKHHSLMGARNGLYPFLLAGQLSVFQLLWMRHQRDDAFWHEPERGIGKGRSNGNHY